MKSIFKLFILSFAVLFATTTSAQSAFKPLAKPVKSSMFTMAASNPTITAWRFTPMAGYNISTQQLQAGIGYGIQWLHFVDSTQKYYTDFSIQAVGWVNGNTTPSLYPPNFASFGITVGAINQLIQIGAAYTPPNYGNKGNVGLIVNFAIPLNN
jgi:hypothetical protein